MEVVDVIQLSQSRIGVDSTPRRTASAVHDQWRYNNRGPQYTSGTNRRAGARRGSRTRSGRFGVARSVSVNYNVLHALPLCQYRIIQAVRPVTPRAIAGASRPRAPPAPQATRVTGESHTRPAGMYLTAQHKRSCASTCRYRLHRHSRGDNHPSNPRHPARPGARVLIVERCRQGRWLTGGDKNNCCARAARPAILPEASCNPGNRTYVRTTADRAGRSTGKAGGTNRGIGR